MSREVRLTRQAAKDLQDLFEWLADEAGQPVAARYIERLTGFLTRLDIFRNAGHAAMIC